MVIVGRAEVPRLRNPLRRRRENHARIVQICSHYFRFKLRAGPCRHMQAVRRAANGEKPVSSLEQWFSSLMQ